MRFASLIVSAFLAVLPFATTAQWNDFYADGGPSIATPEDANLEYEVYYEGVLNRLTGCTVKRGRYMTDAMIHASTMLGLVTKLREGKRSVSSHDGRMFDLEGSSKITSEELLQLEERYFGKLSKERQDTITIGDQIFEWCNEYETNCEVYGRGASQTLAGISSRQALQNADNYAFYVADVALAFADGMNELERRRQGEVEASWPSSIESTARPDKLSNDIIPSERTQTEPDVTTPREDEPPASADDTTITHLSDDSESLTDVSQTQSDNGGLTDTPRDDHQNRVDAFTDDTVAHLPSSTDVSGTHSDDDEPTNTLPNSQQNRVDPLIGESMNEYPGYLRSILNRFGVFRKRKYADGRGNDRISQEAPDTSSEGVRTTSMADEVGREEL
ncbi:uncharacterized protein MYCFIDRAFT_80249 [Pseudocercospora fijiensis CIRAD86]|uniref:Uncharacterized protein n=1 Tax=Pseudocercospora fijiensis (strain CIRAD86) TaxID=383855 RepID=M2YY71_PSEFD|nr:uncharacterized protein MYCFIDRAFT_80249 [Pseudocercospora fijiensis CIRAD86]EME82610.1 hypothetical protein MYCFIDRAFT_80249 [Pseudocercospora fijiensis CIRAD86]